MMFSRKVFCGATRPLLPPGMMAMDQLIDPRSTWGERERQQREDFTGGFLIGKVCPFSSSSTETSLVLLRPSKTRVQDDLVVSGVVVAAAVVVGLFLQHQQV